jgi:hypothetical protein
VSQIGTLVGEQGAAVIQQALDSAREPAQGLVASLVGFVMLLFGATGVFGELQSALQRLWLQGRTTTSTRLVVQRHAAPARRGLCDGLRLFAAGVAGAVHTAQPVHRLGRCLAAAGAGAAAGQ